MTTGVDLVKEQIRAAAGERIDLPDTRPWHFAATRSSAASTPKTGHVRTFAGEHHRVLPAGRQRGSRRFGCVRWMARAVPL